MKIETHGDTRKPAAVFLHGYGAHPKLYKSFVDSLAEDYYVYVPEIFGLNGTCRRNFTENLGVIGAMLKEKKLENSTVIGHSYGALAAMHLASGFPTLKKAIAVNPLLPEIFNAEKFKLQLDNLQRDIKYATGELMGMLANPAVGIAYGTNLIANPVGYIEGAARAIASGLPENNSPVPVELVYADLDTLFHIEDADLGRWRNVLPQLKFTAVADYSHNWLIYHGGFAYNAMKELL